MSDTPKTYTELKQRIEAGERWGNFNAHVEPDGYTFVWAVRDGVLGWMVDATQFVPYRESDYDHDDDGYTDDATDRNWVRL